ncbi:MAG: 30S ribosomal protein S3 [Candidatus Nealsonbacteria bacterium]
MSHKVHPKVYRLKNLEDWGSRWISTKKTPQYLEEDFRIRELLKEKIGKLGTEKVEIERFPGKLLVIIYSSRPGLIIGRGGTGIEDLKKLLEKKVFKKLDIKNKEKRDIKIDIKEVKDPWTSAILSAQWAVQQLERRMPHRKTLKQAIEKMMSVKTNQGARIEMAGRLGGAEIARREWLKKGRMPRQTIRADIDYASETARTGYGAVGIKVWIYKGEKFE